MLNFKYKIYRVQKGNSNYQFIWDIFVFNFCLDNIYCTDKNINEYNKKINKYNY